MRTAINAASPYRFAMTYFTATRGDGGLEGGEGGGDAEVYRRFLGEVLCQVWGHWAAFGFGGGGAAAVGLDEALDFEFFIVVPLLHDDLLEGFFGGRRVEFGFRGELTKGGMDGDLVDHLALIGGDRLEAWQVGAGDLHGVEEQAGAAGIDLVVGEALGNFGDRGLDGAAVVEEGKIEGGFAARNAFESIGVAVRSGTARAVVVVAEGLVAETLGAAAVAVGKDVAALEVLDFELWHGWGTHPGVSM